MTHYFLAFGMTPAANQFAIEDMQRIKFQYDKEFCKREGICSCPDFANACMRELRLFEVDIPTPASAHFEEYIRDLGFIDPVLQAQNLRLPSFIVKFIYKILDKIIIRFTCTGVPKWLNSIKGKYDPITCGTCYRPFSPISRRFARELPPPYTNNYKYNTRNYVIGRTIEHPVGSFTKTPCKKCGFNVSTH